MHIKDSAVKGAKHGICKALFEVDGIKIANQCESLLIHECVFHDNPHVRANILNRGGGGGENERNKAIPLRQTQFTIYVRYNTMSYGASQANNNCILDGNLNRQQITSVFNKLMKTIKIEEELKNKTAVYFGIASDLTRRMYDHNEGTTKSNEGVFGAYFVPSASFEDCALLKAGSKIGMQNGETIVVSTRDIRRMEMTAIYEFSFGAFSQYSARLVNQLGGGESFKDT